MRIGPKLLIMLGAAGLATAIVAVMLYSLEWSSQYSGLVSWVASRSPGMEPGSPEYEEVRLLILNVLGRTNTPFLTVAIALAVSGIVMIVAGVQWEKTASESLAVPTP